MPWLMRTNWSYPSPISQAFSATKQSPRLVQCTNKDEDYTTSHNLLINISTKVFTQLRLYSSVIRETFVSILLHFLSAYSAFFVQKSLRKEPKPYKTNEKYTYTTHTNPTFETPTQHTSDKQVANFMRISTVVSGVNPMFFSKFAVCTQ